MHDNDPKHSSRLVKNWLSEQQISVLDWPAQSPDLNPIENLWNDVDFIVKDSNPKNLDELWRAIKSAWDTIPSDRCKRLVESLPKRCREVIRSKGYPTKY